MKTKLTPEDLVSKIKDVEYVSCITKAGQHLRWAVITLSNGYAVVGDPSVAVSPENDDEVIGKKIAYDNSFNKIWQLEGYLLKEKLNSKVKED